jgi:hypothetical protein
MKTFYSIIFTPLSALSNERINLGLLVSQEGGVSMVKFSEEKLSLLKKFLPAESYTLLKIQLASFENLSKPNNDLKLDFKQLNSDFIQYLSNYTNNLISLTPPKKIDVEASESVFKKLFEQYIYKSSDIWIEEKKRPSKLAEVKRRFIPKVSSRVNVDYTLKASDFDFVVFNLNVDLIGKNDAPVLTQFVDFQTSAEAIKHRVNDYVSLIKPFEIKESKIGKFFIVGQEPDKELNKQHLIWENLIKSPLVSKDIVEIVSPNELERIQDYLEEHDVRPFEVFENKV